MEENKTIFNYISQVFAIFGNIVLIFIIFSLVIGKQAREISSLFELGDQGLSIATLLQLLLLAIIISIGQITFLTDRWIKNMSLLLRMVIFFLLVMCTIILFVVLFGWFPITEVKAWIGFFLSFSICTAISVGIGRLEEQAENKKMEEALEKYKKKVSENR